VTENATPGRPQEVRPRHARATVNLNAGSARATLLMGGKAADNTVYARDASKQSVVTVESALLDD
jgi:hypothetical protein